MHRLIGAGPWDGASPSGHFCANRYRGNSAHSRERAPRPARAARRRRFRGGCGDLRIAGGASAIVQGRGESRTRRARSADSRRCRDGQPVPGAVHAGAAGPGGRAVPLDRRPSGATRIPVRPACAGAGTPGAAHGRRKHRRISAGGRPGSREQDGARRVSARCRLTARNGRSDRSTARAAGTAPQGCGLMRPRVLARLLQIQRALVRHGLDDFVRATHLYRPFRFLAYLSPWTWFQRSIGVTRGERLRLALEALGPIFVKFGQALSTRRDLLPADLADELAKLQDRVPPFPGELALAEVERAFGKPIAKAFERFELQPVASASVAQVHLAVLPGGTEAAVKILRPRMMPVIAKDLALMDAAAGLVERFWADGKRLRPHEVVAEFARHLSEELDLMREAAHASQLRRNFLDSPLLAVPEVYWDFCTSTVMTMQRMRGTPVSEVEELRRQGVDIPKLARTGV